MGDERRNSRLAQRVAEAFHVREDPVDLSRLVPQRARQVVDVGDRFAQRAFLIRDDGPQVPRDGGYVADRGVQVRAVVRE